jgi:NitT/TauT family transport system ATP-binding protein
MTTAAQHTFLTPSLGKSTGFPASAPRSQGQSEEASGLQIEGLHFAYNGTSILHDITLSIAEGEFICLLGPSGCGKTTLLRLLAGLETSSGGRISWNHKAVEGPSLERGLVFQDYSLFPWMTLTQNITLALRKSHPEMGARWRKEVAEEYLRLVGLADSARKHPLELSGGMQQRGAIARALAVGSPVLLMDEPFGALDPINRAKLQDLLLEIWASSKPRKTIVFVTHDVDEAIYIADRVVMLGSSSAGVIDHL